MKEFIFAAKDGTKLNVSVWDEVENPKGGVYIAHGMSEYSARYNRFAQQLNKAGYLVLAIDQRGHGKTAKVRGVVLGDSFADTVEDTAELIEYIKNTYLVEVFLLGHSYGSAVAQAYLEKYSQRVKGAILSGTSYFKCIATQSGKVVAALGKAFCGADAAAKPIAKLSFGMYNKPFQAEGENAWLTRDREEVAKYNASEDCGYVLSYGFYDSFFKGVSKMYGKNFAEIRKDIPILIAVGECDPVSENTKLAKKLQKSYQKNGIDAQIKIYGGARHEILNETNKEEVSTDLIQFIERCFEGK